MKAVYNYSIHIYIHINLCSSLLYNTNIQDIYHHPPNGSTLNAWNVRLQEMDRLAPALETPPSLDARVRSARGAGRRDDEDAKSQVPGSNPTKRWAKDGMFFLGKHPENRKVELWLVYEEIEEQVEYGMVKDILVSRVFDLQIPLVQDD